MGGNRIHASKSLKDDVQQSHYFRLTSNGMLVAPLVAMLLVILKSLHHKQSHHRQWLKGFASSED
jgi:hypothetical protein